MSCQRPCLFGANCINRRCRCNFRCHDYNDKFACLIKYSDTSGSILEEIIYHQATYCEVAQSQCIVQSDYAFTPVFEERDCFELEDHFYSTGKAKRSVVERYFKYQSQAKFKLCDHSFCSNHGICYEYIDDNQKKCECKLGWIGAFCQDKDMVKSTSIDESNDQTSFGGEILTLQFINFFVLVILLVITLIRKNSTKTEKEVSRVSGIPSTDTDYKIVKTALKLTRNSLKFKHLNTV